MTTLHPSSERAAARPPRTSLRVSTYDKASSFLITALIMVGVTAAALFGIWLLSVLVFTRVPAPIQMIQYPGRGDHAAGYERDAEPPGLEELEVVMEEPQLEAALEPVTDLASTVAASFDSLPTEELLSSKGPGRGDSRPPGPEGEGINVIPPWERWEFQYASSTRELYAQQLDFFKIELAAIGGSKLVDYASNLSRNPPTARQGTSKDEKRIYFTFRSGQLRDFDEQLLQLAGISTEGRIVMQFIPEEVNQTLHRLEFENAPDRIPQEWLKTIFGVRPKGSGFEYYIIEQLFRPAPPT